MSSLSIPDEVYYYSRIFQRDEREPVPGKEDLIVVSFNLIKKNIFYVDDISDFSTDESTSVRAILMHFSNDYLRQHISLMARDLSILGVPREEQPTILDKLFEVVKVSRPERRIVVLIAQVAVSLLGSFHDLNTVERVITEDPDINVTIRFGDDDGDPSETYQFCGLDYHGDGVYDTVLQESFEALTLSFTPATRSSIESLPKVRLDSLEQATMEQISTCSICKDEFAEGGVDQLISPLPCAHHFHADCISLWLETSHLCPLCRHALPTVEDGDPSNS